MAEANPSTPRRGYGWVLAPVLVFAALAAVFGYALQSGDPHKLPSALIGKPVPETTFPPLEGAVESGKPVPGFASADLAKGKVTIVNAPGTVDSGYRGEIKVCLLNTDPRHTIALRRGDLIAQLVVQRVAQARFVEVQRLPSSERGDAGHGSTGGIDAWRSATDTMKEQA